MVKTHRFDIFLLAQSSTADNLDVAYHLMLREQDLLQLCVQWQSKARGIPCDLPLDGLWGPADADLQGFVVGKAPDNPVASGQDEDESDEDESILGECGQDYDFFEEAESVAFTDIYRAHSYSPDIDISF